MMPLLAIAYKYAFIFAYFSVVIGAVVVVVRLLD